MGQRDFTHRNKTRPLGLFPGREQAVHDEPVEHGLDPSIVLGDRTVPDEGSELVDDPPSAGVERLNVRPIPPREVNKGQRKEDTHTMM